MLCKNCAWTGGVSQTILRVEQYAGGGDPHLYSEMYRTCPVCHRALSVRKVTWADSDADDTTIDNGVRKLYFRSV